MKPAKNTAGISAWFLFSKLKQRFPDKESFSEKAFWLFLRNCEWLFGLLTVTNPKPLIPLELMSSRDFWAWVKEREWTLKILTWAKRQNGVITLENFKNSLPAEFHKENQKCCWEIFTQALELFIWQLSADALGSFQIRAANPVKLSHQPAIIMNLCVSDETAEQLKYYCKEHKTNLEAIFHRIVEYDYLGAEAAKIGIADGVFQELLKQFGGLLIGKAALEKIELYCQTQGLTMPEFFSQEKCKDPLSRANEMKIEKTVYLRLVKYFQGTLNPEKVLA